LVAIDLVGIAEIAEMLGLTTQRIDQLARRDPTFPKPLAELSAGRIWARGDIVSWAKSVGRLDQDP
jgi:prophage regulatory protein